MMPYIVSFCQGSSVVQGLCRMIFSFYQGLSLVQGLCTNFLEPSFRWGFLFNEHYLNENSCSRAHNTFPQITKRMLTTETFHQLDLLNVILSFLKKIQFEKDIHLFFQYLISVNLQENKKPKGIF